AGFLAIVGVQRGVCPRLQLLDVAQSREPDRLSGEDRQQRHKRDRPTGGAQNAEPFRARKQALDELRAQEPEAEYDEPTQRGPEQGAEREAAAGRRSRRQRSGQGGLGSRSDDDAAPTRSGVGVRRRDQDLAIVTAERGRL